MNSSVSCLRSAKPLVFTPSDTCGMHPLTLKRILEYTDLVYYDLKLVDDARHRAVTKSNDLTLRTCTVAGRGAVVIRVPLVPAISSRRTRSHCSCGCCIARGLGMRCTCCPITVLGRASIRCWTWIIDCLTFQPSSERSEVQRAIDQEAWLNDLLMEPASRHSRKRGLERHLACLFHCTLSV